MRNFRELVKLTQGYNVTAHVPYAERDVNGAVLNCFSLLTAKALTAMQIVHIVYMTC